MSRSIATANHDPRQRGQTDVLAVMPMVVEYLLM